MVFVPPIIQQFNESALFKQLGFSIEEVSESALVLEIHDDNSTHQGGFGVLEKTGINGAVISAAMESAMGICGGLVFNDKPAGVIELSVKMLRVIRKKPCQVKAVIDRKTPQLAFVSATLISGGGGVCAKASAIVAKVGGAGWCG